MYGLYFIQIHVHRRPHTHTLLHIHFDYYKNNLKHNNNTDCYWYKELFWIALNLWWPSGLHNKSSKRLKQQSSMCCYYYWLLLWHCISPKEFKNGKCFLKTVCCCCHSIHSLTQKPYNAKQKGYRMLLQLQLFLLYVSECVWDKVRKSWNC